MKNERKRRVKIRVLPNEGYNIDAELEKNTSIEEVISTLEELGFKYLSEERPLQNKKYYENKLIENIYNKYLSITQNYRESIKSSEKFYENWIKIGFDIIDLKDTIRKNSSSISSVDSSSRITETIKQQQNKNSLSSNLKNSIAFSQERGATLGNETRSLTDDIKPITVRTLEIEEEAPDIRPIFGVETQDSCKYCTIFKDMGNIVCPNCGRALNLKIGA